MTSKSCEVYTVPQMVNLLTDNTAIQRSVDEDAHAARILLLSSAYVSYASFNPNIIKALPAFNSSSPLHPILSCHLAHSCPPTYGYSPTNTSRDFQNPTRHLFFSGKLPHASSRTYRSTIHHWRLPVLAELFPDNPGLFWVRLPTPLISYGIVRQSHVPITDVTSQE